MALLSPTTINTSQVVDNTVTVTASTNNTDIGRTGLAIYRKTAPWGAQDAPSTGIEVGYVEGTGPLSVSREERLAFGTYYYAAFNINKATNEFSSLITASAVTSPTRSDPIYNILVQNLPQGTHYFTVIASNFADTLTRFDLPSVTVGPSAGLPLPATSLTTEYLGLGTIKLTLTNPADTNRFNSRIYRKTTAWTSNDTTGATLVATFTGSSAGTNTIFDENLTTNTYYYAVINQNEIGNLARLDATSISIVAKLRLNNVLQAFPGSVGVALGSPWLVNSSGISGTSTLVTLGDNTARIRLGKDSAASEGFYTLEYENAIDLNFSNEINGRVLALEHSHPTDAIELNFYITNQALLTDPRTADKYVLIRYSTIGAADGSTTVITKNGTTTTTRGSLNHASGTTTSTVINNILFAGDTIRVAVRDRLGQTQTISLTGSSHPFTTAELQAANIYLQARRVVNTTTDVILSAFNVFKNLGDPVTNIKVTPLKSDNSEWVVGENTSLYVKTKFDATPVANDPSHPKEFVITVDDVEWTPRPLTLPVIYDQTLSFDVNHTISIRTNNRSPFAVLFTDPPSDVQIPSLVVDGPGDGATISTPITFTAVASSADGIREVRWYLDNRLIRTDATSPYSFTLDPDLYVSGTKAFRVIAVGNDGGTNSISRTYNVQGINTPDNTGPGVVLLNLDEGENIINPRQVILEVIDPSGIELVRFKMDGNVVAVATTPSYVFTINPSAFTEGAHVFSVEVVDTLSNTTTISRNITITPPVQPPAAQIKGDVNYIEAGLRNRNDVVWVGTFDGTPDWYSTWFLESNPTNLTNLEVVSANSLDGKSLRVKYPGSSTNCFASPRYPGGGGTSQGGTRAYMDISTTDTPDQEELYLRYYVRFDPGFAWIGGGKLPGLAGGNKPYLCDGYNSTGWSGLHMWGPQGQVRISLIADGIGSQNMNNCGLTRLWRVNGATKLLRPGIWHCIEARYKMNTPGQNDGIYQGWLDGELALTLNNVRYRPTGQTWKIDTLFFGTWYGGTSCNWLPKTTQYVQFDSFALAKNRVRPRV